MGRCAKRMQDLDASTETSSTGTSGLERIHWVTIIPRSQIRTLPQMGITPILRSALDLTMMAALEGLLDHLTIISITITYLSVITWQVITSTRGILAITISIYCIGRKQRTWKMDAQRI